MADYELNFKIAGFSGEGIMISGLIFSKTCARHGLSIFDYTEYPSIITGGHNTYQIHAAAQPIYAQKYALDILLALNENAIVKHKAELTPQSLVIYDSRDDKIDIAKHALPCAAFDLPMVQIAEEVGKKRLFGNMVGLAAASYFLGLDVEILKRVLGDIFGRKGAEVVHINQAVAQAGFDYARQGGVQPIKTTVTPQAQPDEITLTGNEAIALGAIAGGMKFYAAYPMTPSSSVLHYLAANEKEANIVVKHAEDEISAINTAIGAAFTGVRAMTGTSGGGFSYMVEALGLSGVAELPLVVLESMRPGPALGMPTWTAQGDLQFVLTASQDEFPRFILTPGDAAEAFALSKQAQELAEKYQTVVILVSDKYLSESRFHIATPAAQQENQRFGFAQQPQIDQTGFFARYAITDSGLSERSVPGTPGAMHIANSYEHDHYGLASEEADMRIAQMDKRQRKFALMQQEIPEQYYEGSAEDQITFISFGSTKNSLREARRLLAAQGVHIGFLNLTWVWPFPIDQVKKVVEGSQRVVVIEGNQYGQLANLMGQELGQRFEDRFNKYDGRPFYAEEIVEFVVNNGKMSS